MSIGAKPTAPARLPAGADDAGDGIAVGSGARIPRPALHGRLLVSRIVGLGVRLRPRSLPSVRAGLFANRPPEGGPGLSDAELIAIGRAVGIAGEDFAACVAEHAYLAWAAYVTARAVERGVNGTPTVLVEGVPVPASARLIAEAVAAVVP